MTRMMLALMYFLIVAHKASFHILSEVFLKSMKIWYGRDSADAASFSHRGS